MGLVRRRLDEPVDSRRVVDDEQLIAMTCRERNDVERCLCQLTVPNHFCAVMMNAPYRTCRIVSVDVRAFKRRVSAPVVNDAARERSKCPVVMLDGGRREFARALLSIEIERVASFVDAPTAVVAALDQAGQIPTDPGRCFRPTAHRFLRLRSLATDCGDQSTRFPRAPPFTSRKGLSRGIAYFIPAAG